MGVNNSSSDNWFRISNPDEVWSPALLIFPDRVESNIRKMIEIAGNPERLRPHVKTHKMPEIVKLQLKHGINKFKCATLAEAEMAAGCGAKDILLAYQPVGPNIRRFFQLRKKYPDTHISCIADCDSVIKELSVNSVNNSTITSVWLDINTGMDRTGVYPGEAAVRLYRMIADLPGLVAGGLHVYDGHIHEKELSMRKKICDEAYEAVTELISGISRVTGDTVRVIAGGTPTFPVHAARAQVETSPGTTLLWDWGYSSSFTDMEFKHAAVLLTRVVSRPAPDLVCIDLGHKALGSEMPHPRIKLCEYEDYEFISHNEEHMVIRMPSADKLKVGDVLYGIPWHICPTVDRHDKAYVVTNGKVTGQWNIEARKRQITI